jgi:hypothetical protein
MKGHIKYKFVYGETIFHANVCYIRHVASIKFLENLVLAIAYKNWVL